jgi:hypothetical protein
LSTAFNLQGGGCRGVLRRPPRAVEVSKKNPNGVIICQGGRFGGWTLFLKNARPIFTYNWVG